MDSGERVFGEPLPQRSEDEQMSLGSDNEDTGGVDKYLILLFALSILIVLSLIACILAGCRHLNEPESAYRARNQRRLTLRSEIAALRYMRENMDAEVVQAMYEISLARESAQHEAQLSEFPPEILDTPPMKAHIVIHPSEEIGMAVMDSLSSESSDESRHLSPSENSANAPLEPSSTLHNPQQTSTIPLASEDRLQSQTQRRGSLLSLDEVTSHSFEQLSPFIDNPAEYPPYVSWNIGTVLASEVPWFCREFGVNPQDSSILSRVMTIMDEQQLTRKLRKTISASISTPQIRQNSRNLTASRRTQSLGTANFMYREGSWSCSNLYGSSSTENNQRVSSTCPVQRPAQDLLPQCNTDVELELPSTSVILDAS